MKSFDINRFGKTLRWVVGVNIRSLLIWSLGYVVGVFLGEQMFFALSVDRDLSDVLGKISQFCSIFIIIALCVGIGTLFVGLNKKPRREAFLMLPASNLEKFLAVVVYVTFIWTFFVILSYVAGDTLRMVYRALVNGDAWISTVSMVADTNTPNFVRLFSQESSLWYLMMNTFVVCAFLVWIHSLYILGGTLFRKYSFVVSSLVFILAMWLFVWLEGHLHLTIFSSSWEGGHCVKQIVGPLAYVLAVVLPLLSCYNYWASFHIFKNIELISNKWTNYDILKR